MLDGCFDPDFLRALAGGQVSASDRPYDEDETATDPVVLRLWISVAGLVAVICLLTLA